MVKPVFTTEVYLFQEDEVLMFKRSETKKKFPGFWSLPGGHIEENEDPASSAVREVKEETGIDLHPRELKLKVVAFHHHIDRGETYIAFVFATNVAHKITPKKDDIEGSAYWVKKSEMLTKENVFEPVKYYFDHILNNRQGIIYNRSEWKNSQLVRVLSETIDRNE